MGMALAAVHRDIERISALIQPTQRVMTEEEAATMTGYLRALGGIIRDRQRPGPKNRLGDKSWEELMEMAKEIPGLEEAIRPR